jgi:formylglycine-generating enzyme required for sulfatase activity
MKRFVMLVVAVNFVVCGLAAQQPAAPNSFVRINGGTFTMGSPANEPERTDIEGPQHQVTLSSFYMGKYEVTQKEYQEIMGTNPSYFKGDNLPVEQVSWKNALYKGFFIYHNIRSFL